MSINRRTLNDLFFHMYSVFNDLELSSACNNSSQAPPGSSFYLAPNILSSSGFAPSSPIAPVTRYSEAPLHLFSAFCGSSVPATLLSPPLISETLSSQAHTAHRATSLLLTRSLQHRLKSWSASLTILMDTWLPVWTACSYCTVFNIISTHPDASKQCCSPAYCQVHKLCLPWLKPPSMLLSFPRYP